MDLVVEEHRDQVFRDKEVDILRMSQTAGESRQICQCFKSSIWDESLYKAWSRIVHTLIPNVQVLSKHLNTFAATCGATEVIIFDRTTFLVIATSATSAAMSSELLAVANSNTSNARQLDTAVTGQTSANDLDPTRYERTSEIIKAFKLSCSRTHRQFVSTSIQTSTFTAVLEELTRNTYMLVIAHDEEIETAALRLNLIASRAKFEQLQSVSISS